MSSALEFTNVHAGYGDCAVLEGMSFEVGAGRLVALLGRNGAGKTTCMNVAIGFIKPSDGEVRLFGELTSGATSETIARNGVGLVPQGRRIFRSLTVYENLRVAERPPVDAATPRWTPDRVYDLFPRLRERRNQIASSLSGGEQQMLSIGRALMTSPRLLLLDEPSEGLAPQIVAELKATLLSLKSLGISVLLVEQNVKLALEVADDAVILNTGRIHAAGTISEISENPELLNYHLGVF